MLGSLNTSSHDHQQSQDHQQGEEASDLQYHHRHRHHQEQQQQQEASSTIVPEPLLPPPPQPSPEMVTSSFHASLLQMRQLLISCGELISHGDFSSASSLLAVLSANSSPYGDSTERLVHQFVKALSLRLNKNQTISMPITSTINNTFVSFASSGNISVQSEEAVHSCYLSLNQITPFIRFSHLTANQAILEAIEIEHPAIHVIDFDILHGVQWPPLMQALVERCSNSLHPLPTLRITGTGQDINVLQRTGDRLLKFAESLGLKFQFEPLLVLNNDPTAVARCLPSAITLFPDEAVAVNCVFYLHKLIKDDARDLHLFLHKIKQLNPKIVTIAEREASHNNPIFMQRFVEALDHYSSLFDSLEATVPPNSRERMGVEQIWLGREIMDIVSAEGEARRERHERFEWWEMMLRSTGFSNVALSPFALSQAKLLLRLHYPSEGFHLRIINNSLFLGWQNRPLFSVSSWH